MAWSRSIWQRSRFASATKTTDNHAYMYAHCSSYSRNVVNTSNVASALAVSSKPWYHPSRCDHQERASNSDSSWDTTRVKFRHRCLLSHTERVLAHVLGMLTTEYSSPGPWTAWDALQVTEEKVCDHSSSVLKLVM